ncbi:histidyl-tRNA synthetase [Ekhidna lutea]|uniref:Histidine--tRNA ligase n=1 Tax=Ekhidna lutea TaxID=447679 RepID=A0A239LIP5_EKHLU|nr:histidine--tRNA ligase [Ekhidna lutea]SNT29539.1 histidyl-tRNA synthetase [Ekhidna lutea]
MSKSKPTLPRGTRDFGPEVSAKRTYIIDKIKQNFIKYGFSQLETPSMENLSVLTGKYGDEGDQLLYKILNSGDYLSKTNPSDYELGSKHLTNKIADKGLRYDLTVPFARYVVMNQHEISFPFKRFQIQPVWRADRPQKGRYREFYQCDADIIGSRGIWNEAELTLLFNDVFNDLGLEDYVIKINHREILFMLAEYVELKDQAVAFCAEIDKLDKIGEERVIENVLVLGGDNVKMREVMELLTSNSREHLIEKVSAIDPGNKGVKEIIQYFEALDQFADKNLKIELDLSLARGLSYYTGMIYEVKPTSVQMGSICGGGRYDNLTGVFGLQGISGIGISFGLDRIYDVMEELDLFPEEITQRLEVLIVHFSESNLLHSQTVVMKLREAGIKADLYPESDKIKKQFNYADKIQTPFTLIIGDDEVKTGKFMLKDMKSGNQKPMTLDEIIREFKG